MMRENPFRHSFDLGGVFYITHPQSWGHAILDPIWKKKDSEAPAEECFGRSSDDSSPTSLLLFFGNLRCGTWNEKDVGQGSF
jgi:hypothetical protein